MTVHGFSSCSVSEGRFHVTGPGYSVEPNAWGVFGGHVLDASSPNPLGWEANDWFEGVRIVNGLNRATNLRIYALAWPSGDCSVNAVRIHVASWGPSAANGVAIQVTQPSSAFCQVKAVIGSSVATDIDRTARLTINDRAQDTDGDGLGDALENAIGTCAYEHGTSRRQAVSPADSDADGLHDGWELLGYDAAVDLPLAFWGASPRHKDVLRFSEGTKPSLVSSALGEGVGTDPSYLTGAFDFGVWGNAVDWNRNGALDAGLVSGTTLRSVTMAGRATSERGGCCRCGELLKPGGSIPRSSASGTSSTVHGTVRNDRHLTIQMPLDIRAPVDSPASPPAWVPSSGGDDAR